MIHLSIPARLDYQSCFPQGKEDMLDGTHIVYYSGKVFDTKCPTALWQPRSHKVRKTAGVDVEGALGGAVLGGVGLKAEDETCRSRSQQSQHGLNFWVLDRGSLYDCQAQLAVFV